MLSRRQGLGSDGGKEDARYPASTFLSHAVIIMFMDNMLTWMTCGLRPDCVLQNMLRTAVRARVWVMYTVGSLALGKLLCFARVIEEVEQARAKLD